MVSDSISPTSNNTNSPKDFNKKKRTNRSAKLKQCKMDARREQWLSQVKNKGAKEDVEDNGCEAAVVNVKDKDLSLGTKLEVKPRGEVKNDGDGGHHRQGSDSDSSPLNSPGSIGSSLSGSIASGTNFTGSSVSGSSSSGGTCSGDVTEEEEEEEEGGGGVDESEDGCVDDWEAIADALEDNDKKRDQNTEQHNEQELSPCSGASSYGGSEKGDLRGEAAKSQFIRVSKFNRGTRAWRPDDTSRPRGLPTVSKPRVLPMKSSRHSGRAAGSFWAYHSVLSVPSSCDCPICYEELDTTDASFFPCPCGFRMCLFCYKRICEDDGRCPGCRKPYKNKQSVEGEASFDEVCSTVGMTYKCSIVKDTRK